MGTQKTIYDKWEDGGITILPPNPVVKLTYKHEFFDISERRIGCRTVTTITADGLVVEKEYRGGSRKVYATKTTTCSVEEFRELCDNLEKCIVSADRWDMYVDDCSAEVKLTYKFGREQIVDRGLGNAENGVAGVM